VERVAAAAAEEEEVEKKKKRVKAVYSSSWETHLRATGRHLP